MGARGGAIAHAVGAGINAMGQHRQQVRDQQGFVQQAAEMFNALGTDEASQFAQNLVANPRSAAMTAEQFGGFEKMYTGMKARAARQTASKALSSMMQQRNSAQPVTAREIIGEMLPEMIEAEVPNAVGLAQTLLSYAQQGQSPVPMWVVKKVSPKDWTPESYLDMLRYGMQSGDWEAAVTTRLKPRPTKDPNQLTPGQSQTAEIDRILLKDRRAMEQAAAGVAPDKIDWVTPAEEAYVNNARKASGLMEGFERSAPAAAAPPPPGAQRPSGKTVGDYVSSIQESVADYFTK